MSTPASTLQGSTVTVVLLQGVPEGLTLGDLSDRGAGCTTELIEDAGITDESAMARLRMEHVD